MVLCQTRVSLVYIYLSSGFASDSLPVKNVSTPSAVYFSLSFLTFVTLFLRLWWWFYDDVWDMFILLASSPDTTCHMRKKMKQMKHYETTTKIEIIKIFLYVFFLFCLCFAWKFSCVIGTFSIRQILGFSILSNKRFLLKYFKQYISSWINKIISSENIVYYQKKSDRHNITNIS